MERRKLDELLRSVRSGETTVEVALDRLSHFPLVDLGHTRLDTQRELRCGFPEVVFGERKEPGELVEIARALVARHARLLVTRASAEGMAALRAALPDCQLHARARAVTVNAPERGSGEGNVLIVSAGTADGPVAEEAELTARMLGARTEMLNDVGVAGLHRLLAQEERLRAANALVVVAGMEGALASVVGGLVKRPVIAVPTSVGYGASFGGLAALLSMLNSCAAGVTVVNIDNGFGAGYAAALINQGNRAALREDSKA
ncbi:MAG: nickel pincer cofactor biosynthesis protein LarB [Planctomycetes bacterium]|nr:nickel pincer cofactor biosynthesis protein LarB [Planctomycetota bacterium]